MKKLLTRLPLILLYIVAFAFGIKSLREPDLWWQFKTGQWILENHRVPTQDVFSYTYAGHEWINIKWGFELLAAALTNLFGVEFVFVLQAIVVCLLVFFLLKVAKALTSAEEKPAEQPLVLFALLLTLFVSEYRLIGRPEMFSHLLAVVFLGVLMKYRHTEAKQVFWLVPLQVVWANMHEAFGMGIVLTAIFTAGAWIEFLLSKRGTLNNRKHWPKTLSILLPVQAFSVVINPNGYKLWLSPFNILNQVYENKFTTELFDYHSADFWQWNVYLLVALLLATIGLLVWYYKGQKTKTTKWKLAIEQLGIGYLLVLIAFVYLSLTAYRNLIFLALMLFPLLAFGAQRWWMHTNFVKRQEALSISLSVLLLLTYLGIVSNKYYEWSKSRDQFGLQVNRLSNPAGAADFIVSHKLSGTCFSDYLTSSYQLYHVPGFKTFIDLRDLDVFPSDFFTTFAMAVTDPAAFEKQDSIYHFSYVVLYRPQFTNLHSYLYNQSDFRLAYADPVACVYTRKTTNADSSTTVFSFPEPQPPGTLNGLINKVLNPIYKGNETQVNKDYIAAGYFISVGRLDVAEEYAAKAGKSQVETNKAIEIQGEIAYNQGLRAPDSLKFVLMNRAEAYYRNSLDMDNSFAPAYLGLGAVLFQKQNMEAALENFENALQYDSKNLNAALFAAECCKYFINRNTDAEGYTRKAIDYYNKADRINPNNPSITLNLGFLYFRINDCSNSTRCLKQVVDYEGLSASERKQAQACIQKCGG